LSEETEPEIYRAIKFGAVLENIAFQKENRREVDYTNVRLTENTRAAYPLEHIPGAKIPAVGKSNNNSFINNSENETCFTMPKS